MHVHIWSLLGTRQAYSNLATAVRTLLLTKTQIASEGEEYKQLNNCRSDCLTLTTTGPCVSCYLCASCRPEASQGDLSVLDTGQPDSWAGNKVGSIHNVTISDTLYLMLPALVFSMRVLTRVAGQEMEAATARERPPAFTGTEVKYLSH